MLGQHCSLLLLGAPGCHPVTTGDKAPTVGSREKSWKVRLLTSPDIVGANEAPTFYQMLFPVTVTNIFTDTPLKTARPLNSLPQWLGSLAPNPGRQSSLASQLSLPESQNPQSRHRQADPRKTPATQKRLLCSRRAGTRPSPLVHSSLPSWHRARHTIRGPSLVQHGAM